MSLINTVRATVLSIANKNNYGYITPNDFNLYAKQAQLDIFEDYFYQYNSQIVKQNARVSGSGYADLVKGIVEVIDSFSSTKGLINTGINLFDLPDDYYLVDKINRNFNYRFNREYISRFCCNFYYNWKRVTRTINNKHYRGEYLLWRYCYCSECEQRNSVNNIN
jgi:hypothetical protein